MNNQTGSDILYRRAQLRALAAPSSVRAIPDLESAAAEFSAGQAATQAAAAEQRGIERQREDVLTERGRQFDSRLTERDREFAAQIADHQRYMDIWEKQNRWATALGVMNLAAQGLSAWDQSKAQDRQADAVLKQQETLEKMLSLSRIANTEQRKRQSEAQAEMDARLNLQADDIRTQLALTRGNADDIAFLNALAKKRYGETPETIPTL